MKKIIIISVSVLLFLAILIGTLLVYSYVNSPEYALKKMIADVKDCGFEAVEDHLTDETREKIAPIIELSQNRIIKNILTHFSKTDYASTLIDKAKDVEWEIRDISKGKKRSYVTIGFNYGDGKFEGSVDLELHRIDGEWKINGLTNFKID